MLDPHALSGHPLGRIASDEKSTRTHVKHILRYAPLPYTSADCSAIHRKRVRDPDTLEPQTSAPEVAQEPTRTPTK